MNRSSTQSRKTNIHKQESPDESFGRSLMQLARSDDPKLRAMMRRFKRDREAAEHSPMILGVPLREQSYYVNAGLA